MKYIPRRASKRFLDSDCPDGVLWICRHPEFADEFTVYYRKPVCGTTFADTAFGYRGMSEFPFHPQGVGMYGEISAYDLARYRRENYRKSCKWSDLPRDVKKCVLMDLKGEAE